MQCDCCVAFFWLLLLVLLCGLNVNNQNTKFTFNWILYMQFEVAMERNIQECSGVSTSDESTIPPNIYFCFVILNVFSNQIQIIFYNFPPPPLLHDVRCCGVYGNFTTTSNLQIVYNNHFLVRPRDINNKKDHSNAIEAATSSSTSSTTTTTESTTPATNEFIFSEAVLLKVGKPLEEVIEKVCFTF